MDITTALTKLFAALPPRKGHPSELVEGYKIALHGCSSLGLGQAVLQYIRGEVEGMATSYAPTPPELARAVRVVDAKERKARLDEEEAHRPRIEAPAREKPTGYATALNAEFQAWHNGAAAGPLMRTAFEKHFGDKRDQIRRQYASEGRTFLRAVASHQRANEMAKHGDIPPGSVYSGLLGEFWSPPYYQPPTEGNDDEQRPHHDERTDPDGTPGLSAEPDPVQLDPDPGSADWRQWFDATPETEKAPDIDDGGIDDNGGFAGPA